MSAADSSIGHAEVQDLIGKWWWNYDQGHFDILASLLTDDVHFSCRTDTGTTDYEALVRADLRTRDLVMAWQTEHRVNSPYPLRHVGANLHITADRGDEVDFASYIFVTHITAAGVSNLSSAIVTGTVRRDTDAPRIAELEVALDTRQSVVFSEVFAQ